MAEEPLLVAGSIPSSIAALGTQVPRAAPLQSLDQERLTQALHCARLVVSPSQGDRAPSPAPVSPGGVEHRSVAGHTSHTEEIA